MGCTNSKLDDLPAVALCRERCGFLDEAMQQRFLLAETHAHYVHSLKQMGYSLHRFINQDGGGGDSPQLNLPPAKKGGDAVGITVKETSSSLAKGEVAHHSHSNSGDGHIKFHSDPDDDDDESSSLSGSGHSSPLHGHDLELDHHYGFGRVNHGNSYPMMMNADHETLGGFSQGGFTHTNYMKNQPKPSIVYEQRPYGSEAIQHHYVGESSSSTSYYPSYAYTYSNNLSSSYYPPSYGYGGPVPGAGGGNFGLAPTVDGSTQRAEAVASSSKPPAPPSPPQSSPWDFLNPFESYDKYYPLYTPSTDLKELREEEGIPDLEEEDYSHEVKKVHVEEKFVDGNGGGGGSGGVGGAGKDVVDGDVEPSLYQTRASVDNEGVEYEVPVVDKKVVDEERNEERSTAARAGPRDVCDVARELEAQFVRASECGSEIAKMLEVGKLPYQRKHVSKMLHVVTPSLSVVSSQPSTSKSTESSSSTDKAGPALLDIDEDMAMRTRNLSSTLHKLYLWEKKLYHEVKKEEKMRVTHDRTVQKLKRLDERGAEAHKVDSTRTSIRSLSIKIGMAIQVVDKISVTINKIRDEELWPQLNELIQGLTRMWKSMLECHHNQCQATRETRGLGPIGSGEKLGDASSQLEHEALNWIFRFSSWIGAQKGYVRALNSWLMRCLLYEPEETADGIVPFSPGRIGAPPIFVICNQWSQALDRISEKEVIDCMRVLALSVLQLWEHDKPLLHQKMVENKDYERKVKNLDREEQKIQKEIQALDKKIILVSRDGNSQLGNIVYQSDTSSSSLQGSLQRFFEALERFTAESVKVYEELLQRTEEELHAQQSERVS